MYSLLHFTAALPVLPSQQRLGPGAEDFALIPPLRVGGGIEEWSFPAFPGASSNGITAKFGNGQSALLGEYRPPQAAVQPVASTTR